MFIAPAALLLLSTLASGVVIPEEREVLEAKRILWRYDTAGGRARRSLAICGEENGSLLSQPDRSEQCYGHFSLDASGATTSISFEVDGVRKCLDATSEPGDGVRPHLWDCYDGLAAQLWMVQADGSISLSGQGLCLDVTDGDALQAIQLWTCNVGDGNGNQKWDIL